MFFSEREKLGAWLNATAGLQVLKCQLLPKLPPYLIFLFAVTCKYWHYFFSFKVPWNRKTIVCHLRSGNCSCLVQILVQNVRFMLQKFKIFRQLLRETVEFIVPYKYTYQVTMIVRIFWFCVCTLPLFSLHCSSSSTVWFRICTVTDPCTFILMKPTKLQCGLV